jgi:N-6 DNA Methylase
VFVEEFILDRTLDPAIEEFGLSRVGYENRLLVDGRLAEGDRFRMIDPACGSGHFLLGSFARLLERWRRKEPGTKDSVLVQRAFDSVHGVDLNPYAVAIARFRLLLAAMKEFGVVRLKDAPGFEIHIACGDSLLHGSPGGDQLSLGWSSIDHVYQPEDKEVLDRLLQPGRYHAVVANPPYITPKDASLNAAYRERFARTCHMKYSLAVPFLERIFSLAIDSGFTGQITTNSFMKREFGKKLIEVFFPTVDLTHVIDVALAYIPGHGTPPVILFGRHRRPSSNLIRTVFGIRRELPTPDLPSKGKVWLSILEQIDDPGAQNAYMSTTDSERTIFHRHPWTVGGGGAAELKEAIDARAETTLSSITAEIGVLGMTNADEVMLAQYEAFERKCVERFAVRPIALGDDVRDWAINPGECSLFPYQDGELARLSQMPNLKRWIWPNRTVLGNRATFSKKR